MQESHGWPGLEVIGALDGIPAGFEVGVLSSSEVDFVSKKVLEWYPDVRVGLESVHTKPSFYEESCYLFDKPGSSSNDVLPVVVRKDGLIAALVTFMRFRDSLVLTSRLGVVAPEFRGEKIGHLGPRLLEHIAKAMDYEMIYYQATLKVPHQQIIAEKLGFALVGILPAIDIDQFEPGRTRRVFEALYAKVLESKRPIHIPDEKMMTERTLGLFRSLFG